MTPRPYTWLLHPDLGYLAPFIPKAGPVHTPPAPPRKGEPFADYAERVTPRHASDGQRIEIHETWKRAQVPESIGEKLWSKAGVIFVVVVVIGAIVYAVLQRFVW